MYQSTIRTSRLHYAQLYKKIEKEILSQAYVSARALNHRKIYLTKYLEVNSQRSDKRGRLQVYYTAIDILKRTEQIHGWRESRGCIEYEILGLDPLGAIIALHIRQELINTGKRLYLISTYKK